MILLKYSFQDALGTQGKYAGVSPESVQCMAEQVAADINSDAANNLAEDTSYRLRQVINVGYPFYFTS